MRQTESQELACDQLPDQDTAQCDCPPRLEQPWPCLSGHASILTFLHSAFARLLRNSLIALQGMTDRMPVLAAASKLAGAEVKKVLRRLHVTGGQQSRKEGMRPFARLVSKIACTGPFSTLSALLSQVTLAKQSVVQTTRPSQQHFSSVGRYESGFGDLQGDAVVPVQVESYSNLVDPVLEAMRNLTPLAFDLLTFLIIDKLVSSGRQKLKVGEGSSSFGCQKSISTLL